jgi:tryptophan synthase beta chain
VRVAIDEALDAKARGEARVIAFNLSGHGHFDMAAYEAYHRGQLEDYEYPEALVEDAMQRLPKVPA